MKIDFNWIGGATFILSIGELNIAVDPVLCKKGTVQDYFWFKSKRLENPVFSEKDFENIDLWLITHNHKDHLDELGLSKISNKMQVISNNNASKIILDKGNEQLSILDWHQTKTFQIKEYEISIEAIPAIHGINPLSALLAGKVNGYYLTISNNKDESIKIYISGDTVYKNKIISSLKNKKIDMLIPNMGAAKQGSWIMTLTLNAKMLEKMIEKLNPKIIIPVHYGTFEHYVEPIRKVEELNNPKIKIVKPGTKTRVIIPFDN